MRSLFVFAGNNLLLANVSGSCEYIETLDLYGSAVERNQCWVSPELEPGVHHLQIAATGKKHEDSSGTLIDVDHFIVH